MSPEGGIYSRLISSWKETRVFAVPANDRTQLVKLKYRQVGQEPYREKA